MRCSLSQDWLFLANPRCGSTSLRSVLTPWSDIVSRPKEEGSIRHHWTAAEAADYLDGIGREVRTFDVFTTARNPWARAASAYVFGGRNPASVWARTRAEAPEFAAFIRHRNVAGRLFDLGAFTFLPNGGSVTVFAAERLEEARPSIERIVGRPVELPRLNQSEPYDYRSLYTDDDAAVVASLFASDIEAFGYVFDQPEAGVVEVVRASPSNEPPGVLKLSAAPVLNLAGEGLRDDPDWRSRMNAAGQTPKWGPDVFRAPAKPSAGMDEAHHRVYGRPWIFGRLQFEQLVRRGLKPKSHVLDLGCGVGRTGVWLIPYLKPDRYVGVESHARSLEVFATYEVPLHGLASRRPLLVEDDQFRLEELGRTFDIILDFCVTVHLTPEWRAQAFRAMRAVLAPGGRIVLAQEPESDATELLEYGLRVAHVADLDLPILSHLPKEGARRMAWHELEPVA